MVETMGSASNAAENSYLDLTFRNVAWPNTAPVFLALCTSVPGEADTGVTIAEATYTGYARLSFATTDWNVAAGGSITTNLLKQFVACSGGTSTIIGWAFCSTSGTSTGAVVVYGSCTSVIINTSQTPAQIASGGIVITCD